MIFSENSEVHLQGIRFSRPPLNATFLGVGAHGGRRRRYFFWGGGGRAVPEKIVRPSLSPRLVISTEKSRSKELEFFGDPSNVTQKKLTTAAAAAVSVCRHAEKTLACRTSLPCLVWP